MPLSYETKQPEEGGKFFIRGWRGTLGFLFGAPVGFGAGTAYISVLGVNSSLVNPLVFLMAAILATVGSAVWLSNKRRFWAGAFLGCGFSFLLLAFFVVIGAGMRHA